MTVFVASMYLFRSVTSLFVHGPKTYWPVSDQQAFQTHSIRPQFVNGAILTGLLVATLVIGVALTLFWNWFANFLAPALALPGASLQEGTIAVGVSVWMLVAIGMAIGGWIYAYSCAQSGRKVASLVSKNTRLYVLFWNKWYFDEIYDAYIVNPTVRFAHWLWRIIDMRLIDTFIHSIATYSILFARWLWRIVDVKGIDRIVMGIGRQSVGMGSWLWQVVDIQWLEQRVSQVGRQADTAGQLLQEAEPRTLQHQLLVMILWLVLATGLLYFLV